jgi:glycolate oxidase FAD binding subunit
LAGILQPSTSEDLRDALAFAGASKRTVELFGGNSKRLMAGSAAESEIQISTARMRRILQYEPRDLTVSVEAGMPLAQLNAELARALWGRGDRGRRNRREH